MSKLNAIDTASGDRCEYDPFGEWNTGRRLKWVALLVVFGGLLMPRFVDCLEPPKFALIDFYQEWSSAKNLFNDLPIYTPVAVSVEHYLGFSSVSGRNEWDVNVHPPTSVLLAIPLQGFDYPTAYRIWQVLSLFAFIASLWLVIRGLNIRMSAWSLLPIATLLFVCEPFYQQVRQGQLNLVLLLLIVGVWAADRRGFAYLAGVLLAAAAAVKLFPAFLVLYFVLQRKWKTVAVTAGSFVLITILTAVVLGTDTYQTYVTEILPTAGSWKSAWNNASLAGLWSKLFNPGSHGGSTLPLVHSPVMALVGTMISWGLVLISLARAVGRSRDQRQRDHAFALTIVAMLLISPVTWEHYFLLLLIPLAVIWRDLPKSRLARWSLILILTAMFQPIFLLCNNLIPGGFAAGHATAAHTLTLLSFQLYALCGLYYLGLQTTRQSMRSSGSAHEPTQRDLGDASSETRLAVPARLAVNTD